MGIVIAFSLFSLFSLLEDSYDFLVSIIRVVSLEWPGKVVVARQGGVFSHGRD